MAGNKIDGISLRHRDRDRPHFLEVIEEYVLRGPGVYLRPR